MQAAHCSVRGAICTQRIKNQAAEQWLPLLKPSEPDCLVPPLSWVILASCLSCLCLNFFTYKSGLGNMDDWDTDAKPLEQCQSCRKHCICVLLPSAWFGTQQPLPTSGPLCPHCSLPGTTLPPMAHSFLSPSSFCSMLLYWWGLPITIFKTEILSLIVSIKPVAYSLLPHLFFSFSWALLMLK